ncbi:MAG TPA: hypothetical protein PKC40_05845, partial [Saprospiraceae bacterium]|nr:hypothetical protein [Saprospiraceae bacterium]
TIKYFIGSSSIFCFLKILKNQFILKMVCKKFAKVFKKSGAARSRMFNLTALLYHHEILLDGQIQFYF